MAANGDPICKHGIYWHHCGKCQMERETGEIGIVVRDPHGEIYRSVRGAIDSGSPVFVKGEENKESIEDILAGIFKALVKAEHDDPDGFNKAFSKENMKRYQEFIKARS